MSTIFIDRFVSSVNNENINIDDKFNSGNDSILNANDIDPVLPEEDTLFNSENCNIKKPDIKEDKQELKYKEFYSYELKRYLCGNFKLVSISDYSKFKNDVSNNIIKNFLKLDTKLTEEKNEVIATHFLKKYLLRNLLIDKLFSTNHRKIMGSAKRTIFLFPTYANEDSKNKFKKELSDNYSWILNLPDLIKTRNRFYLNNTDKELLSDNEITNSISSNVFKFSHVLSDSKKKNNIIYPNNAVIFIPLIIPNEELTSFETRIRSFFKQVTDTIESENGSIEGRVINEEKLTFTNIQYSVIDSKENEMFTDFYEYTLSKKHRDVFKKVLNETFRQDNKIGRQSIQLNVTREIPIDNLNNIETNEIIPFSKKILSIYTTTDSYTKIKNDYLNLLTLFKEYSKRYLKKEFSSLATSEANMNFLRIYYRTHNMDFPEKVDMVRTGTNYLYKLSGVKLNKIDNYRQLSSSSKQFKDGLYVGFLFRNSSTPTKNVYRFQVHIQKTLQLRKMTNPSVSELVPDNLNDDTEKNTDNKSVMLKLIKNQLTKAITFDESHVRQTLGLFMGYKGKVEEYETLHIYEQYKWFRFNHIDGSLSDEMNIRYYPDIRFDKKTFVEYLKSKNMYEEDKTRIPYEFLKINKDVSSLNEYCNFIQDNYSSTHIYQPSLIGRFTTTYLEELFFEKSIKSGILDIVFTSMNVIYISKPPTVTIGDKDTSKNYKIVSYQEYEPQYSTNFYNENIKYQYGDYYKKMLEQSLTGEEEEYKHCENHKLYKCELMKEFFSSDYLKYIENQNQLFKLKKELDVLLSTNDKYSDVENTKISISKKEEIEILKKKQAIENKKQAIENKKQAIDKFKKNNKYIDQDEQDKKIKNNKLFINNPKQQISMAIVTVTQENINKQNIESFMKRNKCKTSRASIKKDWRSILQGALEPFDKLSTHIKIPILKQQTTILPIITAGNKSIKINKNKFNKKNIFIKKVNKHKKIKPFKFTKKNKKYNKFN
jgi:hypothetical protein